jgi:hypothetical protein
MTRGGGPGRPGFLAAPGRSLLMDAEALADRFVGWGALVDGEAPTVAVR